MRLQTAIEFLTSYAWAIIVVAVVLVALFASGALNPGAFSAQQCVLTSSFSCLTFFLAANGVLTVNLQQATGASINVTAIGCNQNGTLSHMQNKQPANQIFIPEAGNSTFTVQCYSASGAYSSKPGSIFTGYLLLNYTNEFTQLPGSVLGKLSVKVS